MSEPVAAPSGPQRAGEQLRVARERAGMSLQQVAEGLRLSSAVVEALEQGNYALIGAQVFVRGYLRRYAELVGEPASVADAALQEHAWSDPAADLTSTRLRALEGTHDRVSLGRWPLVAVAAVLCVGAIYWWAQRASAPRATSTTLAEEQVVLPPALPADASRAAEGAATAPEGTPPAAAPPAAAASKPAAAPAASQPGAATAPAPAAARAAAPTPATDAAATAGRKHLRLSFHAESWTELYDANGTKLFWGLGEPGDSQAVSGTPPFKLILGNPDGVTVSLEGTALTLPPPRGGTTLRASIDARGAFAPAR